MENSENPSRAQLLLMIESLERRVIELEDFRRRVSEEAPPDNPDEIVWNVGNASLVMKRDGNITFRGHNIDLSASSSVAVKASGDIILKGATIREN